MIRSLYNSAISFAKENGLGLTLDSSSRAVKSLASVRHLYMPVSVLITLKNSHLKKH